MFPFVCLLSFRENKGYWNNAKIESTDIVLFVYRENKHSLSAYIVTRAKLALVEPSVTGIFWASDGIELGNNCRGHFFHRAIGIR